MAEKITKELKTTDKGARKKIKSGTTPKQKEPDVQGEGKKKENKKEKKNKERNEQPKQKEPDVQEQREVKKEKKNKEGNEKRGIWDSKFVYMTNHYNFIGREYGQKKWEKVMWYHWLPENNDLHNDYEEFDTVIHVTGFDRAFNIFTGLLQQSYLDDFSVANPKKDFYTLRGTLSCNVHPLADTKVLWYSPYTQNQIRDSSSEIPRYGNVTFSMKSLYGHGGIVGESGNYNYYFVEITQYVTNSGCKILITKKEYPGLRVYNPYEKGGPWYIKDGKQYRLLHIKDYEGSRCVEHKLEFMREEDESSPYMSSWLCNHEISYKICPETSHSKVSCSLEGQYDNDRVKLALGLLACQLANEDNHILRDWTFLRGDADIISQLQEVHESTEDALKDKNPPYEVDKDLLLENIITPQMKSFFDTEQELPKLYLDILSKIEPLLRPLLLKKITKALEEQILYEKREERFPLVCWKNFEFDLSHKNEIKNCSHWLKNDHLFLGKDENDYEEFNTLIHLSDEMKPKPRVFTGTSVIRLKGDERGVHYAHPLVRTELVIYKTFTQDKLQNQSTEDNKTKVLAMKTLGLYEGIMRNPGEFKYYLIEVEEHEDAAICRILVTREDYPSYSHLQKYDPLNKGGPWYYSSGTHYCLEKIRNQQEKLIPNKLEILRQDWGDDTKIRYLVNQKTVWLDNHETKYM